MVLQQNRQLKNFLPGEKTGVGCLFTVPIRADLEDETKNFLSGKKKERGKNHFS